MTEERIKELQKDNVGNKILNFIPNELGINLCSVKDIIINKQEDEQLTNIQIVFIPA